MDVLSVEVGGAVGFLLDLAGNDAKATYSGPGLFFELAASTPDDGWRPSVHALAAGCVFFAFATPLLNCAALVLLWALPLRAETQARLLAVADLTYGWSALDVLVVSLLAGATQLSAIAKALVRRECRDVDSALGAFFSSALDGDTTCFSLAVTLEPGCVLLAAAAVAHMVLAGVFAYNSNAAVAERLLAANDGAGPKDIEMI